MVGGSGQISESILTGAAIFARAAANVIAFEANAFRRNLIDGDQGALAVATGST